MSLDKKFFCTAPFINLRIENFAGGNPSFKPCCLYEPSEQTTTLDQYLNGAEIQTLRNNMITTDVPSRNCFKCTVPENMGLGSIRHSFLKRPWYKDTTEINSLEIFFGNTCNLGCMMCSSNYSSYASEERYQSGILPSRLPSIDNTQLALDTIEKLPNLKSITLIGGEFFLMKRNGEILDKIIEKNIQCSVTTNASVITKPLLEKLQQIQKLQIGISVDGTKDVYNFMRYPANWDTLNYNIDLMRESIPQAEYCVLAVAQPLNIQNFHEIFEWANKKIIPTQYQVLVSPEYLTWKILTVKEKNMLVNLLKTKQSKYKITMQQKNTIDDFISGIPQDSFDAHLRMQGITYLSKLFSHRKILADKVLQQFGILDELANEVITAMSVQ